MPAYLRWAEDRLLPDQQRSALCGPGAPFEMSEEDVLGAKMPVFVHRYRSARQMLEGAARLYGDRPFLVFPERELTFRSIQEPVAAVGTALVERFGAGPGERVAIAAANVSGHAIAAWAAICVGAAVVELNGWWAGPELVQGIELTRPRVVLADRRRLERIPSGSVDAPLVCLEDELPALEAAGAGRSLSADPVGEDDPIAIMFTSGTTGRPKGAVLSHRGHVNMMMQAALQGRVSALVEPQPAAPEAVSSRPCTIAVSPMFHVSGFTVALIGGTLIGATFVYPPPGRWDPLVHLELTERHRATAWSLVPSQLWQILEHPRLGEFDLSSLRRIGGGGSTFQPELWRRVREVLPQVTAMATGYGMTETCGCGTHQGGRAAAEHPDAVGAPVPGYEIAVRGPGGELLEDGEVGEIHLRGASNFLGYWDDPAATREVLDAERWYRTSELGHIEGGLLYLDGRRNDLIIRGGENVYPIEVENCLVEHPDIVDAAVVGVPDRVMGEQVKAVVVARPGAQLDPAGVRGWVAERLAAFKVPSVVELREQLPRNAAGKVVKKLLLEDPGGHGLSVAGLEEDE